MTTPMLPPPSALLGLTDNRFGDWYEGQDKVFSQLISWFHDKPRFVGAAVPTGGGKSLSALLLAKMSGARTVIITSTKGLQDQYKKDSDPLGGAVVVGQNNFRCLLVPTLSADQGPCHDGLPCQLKQSACPYQLQLQKALKAKIVITNYAYYLAQTNYSLGLGEIGLLIGDEAHQAFSALENFLTIYLSRLEVELLGIQLPHIIDPPPPPKTNAKAHQKGKATPVYVNEYQDTDSLPESPESVIPGSVTPCSGEPAGEPTTDKPPSAWAQWRSWAELSLPTAKEALARVESDIKAKRSSGELVPSSVSRVYRSAKTVAIRLEQLSKLDDEDWVIQPTKHGYSFTPVWVAKHSSKLFGDVPKIMLMSAILSRKTADSLGVPQPPDCSWVEAESYFPPENTPIWHIPTARINYRTDDYGSTIWVSRIDQIIDRRLDRKGIIFTVSYDRARLLLQRSRHRDIMLTHSTWDVVQVVNRFKAMPAPAVLVSPSVTTGWDFPQATTGVRYLIAGKLPYPDTMNPVTKARHEDDKDWSSFMAMETLIQSLGRATRSATDRVECFVCDDSAVWYLAKYAKFAPKWFMARYCGSKTCVPDPLV